MTESETEFLREARERLRLLVEEDSPLRQLVEKCQRLLNQRLVLKPVLQYVQPAYKREVHETSGRNYVSLTPLH